MDTKLHERGSFDMSVDSSGAMVAKVTPAIVGTGVSFSSLPWADIAAFLTCIYVLFQIADWVWKKIKAWREWRAAG